MLVVTRRFEETILCLLDNAPTASNIELSRVLTDNFITFHTTFHRHCRPEVKIEYPNDLLALETFVTGRDCYFDLLLRENIDPTKVSLENLFAQGPIQLTLTSQHRQGVRFGIQAPRQVKVLRGELMKNDLPHRRQGRQRTCQDIPQRLIA